MVKYEGYLTEQKLGTVLQGLKLKPQPQFSFPNSKLRYDYYCATAKLLVEFDGYQHYTKSSVIRTDQVKDLLAATNKVRLIRIPYFVQLTPVVSKYLRLPEVSTDYGQGFISTAASCVLPEDFCLLGLQRFLKELKSLPKAVSREILESCRRSL